MINEEVINEIAIRLVINGVLSGVIVSFILFISSYLILKIWQSFRALTHL